MRSLALYLFLAPIVIVGCRTPGLEKNKGQMLIDTDVAFSQAEAKSGIAAAFRDFAAPDAMVFPQGGQPVRGRANIFESSRNETGRLTWTPRGADLSRSSDLGYTWGEYQFRAKGSSEVRYGKYVTVWKKQSDGSWKFVVDVGNQSPAPE
jgi:ketosteroid isomerase-like protein